MPKSPMLADHDSLHTFPEDVRFPLYGLPKLDGIRCVVSEGVPVSRKFIPIKNDLIRSLLSLPVLEGLDGELISGPLTAENVFNQTTRAVMGNKHTDPDFTFHVFDDFSAPDLPYNERQVKLCERMVKLTGALSFIRFVEPTRLETWEGLCAYEEMVLGFGYEGVITRSPDMPYKFGRSTKKQQGMLKLKRFTDSEAEVVGFVELMVNSNPDIKDNLGHAKRSKAQAGMVPGNTLGTMQCRDCITGIDFEIGMFKGLSDGDKKEIWDNLGSYIGKFVKYSHFSHGAIDKPRHSKFLGWRDESDT